MKGNRSQREKGRENAPCRGMIQAQEGDANWAAGSASCRWILHFRGAGLWKLSRAFGRCPESLFQCQIFAVLV